MNNYVQQIIHTVSLLQKNLYFTLLLLGLLFAIHIVNFIVGYRLNYFGIFPRQVRGLPGIVTSPFLHADFNHLFFNAIPLFVMVSFVLLEGMSVFIIVTAIIIFIGGGTTWLLGRRGVHIGASGVIMGYWGYLLLEAYKHPSIVSVATGIVCIYYFGGMVLNLFPVKVKSSWDAHFFGFLGGLTAAYVTPFIIHYLTVHPYH
jgi:membrane associated rhomboid family serine protease